MQGDRLRNGTAQRVTNNVRRVPTRRVHQRKRVFRHLCNRNRRATWLTARHSTIVETQTRIMVAQHVNLWTPRIPMYTGSLNEQDWRTRASNVVGQAAAAMFNG